MSEKLIRVGTTYLPVQDLELSAEWYVSKLGAKVNYKDQEKAILDLANQSFFLVKARSGEQAQFMDAQGDKRFMLTFEVDGESALTALHEELTGLGVQVGKIEDRGHPGRNFVFSDPDGNLFDVWSELSPKYKEWLR
ncbi:VOC family protein [Mesobacillus maritimus]|uniref:VOC family protein n=1 Tax=Mesobacillus maritimus TaxID=1643336 RepID=UPI00203B78F6|nr:VOC family protein [Mesobacillus maritimus]